MLLSLRSLVGRLDAKASLPLLASSLLAASLGASLAGCGQKGALYHPPVKTTSAAASASAASASATAPDR